MPERATVTDAERDRVGAFYRWYAEHGSRHSPRYAAFASAMAGDPTTLALVATLPALKRHPVLILAAVRYRYGTPADGPALLTVIHDHLDEIGRLVHDRTIQLNEPARCAPVLPLLARLPQPLSLIEVGASAGLCLVPDRYAYDYPRRRRIEAAVAVGLPAPTMTCRARGPVPLPHRPVPVAWRRGLDLDPVNLADPDHLRWLEAQIPPDNPTRLARLRGAVAVAATDPPPVVAGDLRSDLADLVAQAPADSHVVVFHSGVLSYLSVHEREAFRQQMGELPGTWISAETQSTFPTFLKDRSIPELGTGRFVLAVDEVPVATTNLLGTELAWG